MWSLGDTAWLAKFSTNARNEIPCRVCFGKKTVTLILGNDDQVVLPCDYCGKGCEAPTGKETVYETECCSKPFVVSKVEQTSTPEGSAFRYTSTSHERSDGSLLFATKEQADERALRMAADHEDAERGRAEYIKHSVEKSFAWNAGYHLREAKDCERRAEYHRGRAVICKSRSKDKGA